MGMAMRMSQFRTVDGDSGPGGTILWFGVSAVKSGDRSEKARGQGF